MFLSESNRFGRCSKGAENSCSILYVENLSVAVLFVIHTAEMGISIQHRLFRLDAVIFDELAGDSQPNAVLKGAKLSFVIYTKLLGNGFCFACLNVQLVFKKINGAKRSTLG